MLKGISHHGTVVHMAVNVRHIDKSIKEPMLAQACGMSGRAVGYLAPYGEAEPVTCKRCLKIIEAKGLTDPVTTTTPEEEVTTIVAKGANRPAAARKTAKAAQRTPLPPKGATSAAGKNETAEVIKGELAKQAVKKAPQAKAPQTRQTARAELLASRKGAAKPTTKKMPERPTAHAKAEALVADAEKAGWVGAVTPGTEPGDVCSFIAHRDGEALSLHYIQGGTRPGTHVNGGREVQAMNAATVRRILTTPAEAAAKVRAAYAAGKGKAKRAAVKVATAAPLAFNAESTDEDILAIVKGKSVTWTNSISGLTETAVVSGTGKNAPKITGEGTKRALVFAAKGEGFRTARLSSIVSVS